MDLSQQALQLRHLLPCCGAGHVAPAVTTPEVQGQALDPGPSILDPDNLIIKFFGITSGSRNFKNLRSCVGSQCRVSGVCLHTSNILMRCCALWMSPESCHLKTGRPFIKVIIASTHSGDSKAFNLRLSAACTFEKLYLPLSA